jgi:hypothetical protein
VSTLQGCGTRLLGFSNRDEKGYNFATQWFVLFNFPIIPLTRYYLEMGETKHSSSGPTFRYSRSYTIFFATRIHFFEVLLTYLYIYIVLPGFTVLPCAYISNLVTVHIFPDWAENIAVFLAIALPTTILVLNRMRINGKWIFRKIDMSEGEKK